MNMRPSGCTPDSKRVLQRLQDRILTRDLHKTCIKTITSPRRRRGALCMRVVNQLLSVGVCLRASRRKVIQKHEPFNWTLDDGPRGPL